MRLLQLNLKKIKEQSRVQLGIKALRVLNAINCALEESEEWTNIPITTLTNNLMKVIAEKYELKLTEDGQYIQLFATHDNLLVIKAKMKVN